MTDDRRAAIVRRNRPRGIYVPIDEVPAHLACGWCVVDDQCGGDEVLMAPPLDFEEAA